MKAAVVGLCALTMVSLPLAGAYIDDQFFDQPSVAGQYEIVSDGEALPRCEEQVSIETISIMEREGFLRNGFTRLVDVDRSGVFFSNHYKSAFYMTLEPTAQQHLYLIVCSEGVQGEAAYIYSIPAN
jgi:hypothetical protein